MGRGKRREPLFSLSLPIVSQALSFPFSPTSPQQKRREPSGSNSALVGPRILTKQCNQTLKRMATLHEFGLPRDMIISPPHSFFRCLSESFMSFLQSTFFFRHHVKIVRLLPKLFMPLTFSENNLQVSNTILVQSAKKKVRLKKLIRTKNKTKREE